VFGEKEFNLVVARIHPPLGDIKILSDPCNNTWPGVNYDGNMCVVGLDVHGRSLGGQVPDNDDNTSALTLLWYLDLGNNNLSGPLLVLVMPELKRPNLHGKAFTSMPERFFADIRQLEKVYIGNNTLLKESSLPADLRLLADI
jgi:hypothetical protein